MLMPRSAARRPWRAASVRTCWIRWMCEAKVATITRPAAREPLTERLAHVRLRARVTRAVHVRRVRAEDEDLLVAELGEAPVIGRLAVERARIKLEVAGVDDRADRCLDGEPDPVHDRVRHADRLDAEGAQVEAGARPHGPEVGGLEEPVLAQPLADEG